MDAVVPRDEIERDSTFKRRIQRYEKSLIRDALQASRGNKSEAARLLRMPLRTLASKLKSYGIDISPRKLVTP